MFVWQCRKALGLLRQPKLEISKHHLLTMGKEMFCLQRNLIASRVATMVFNKLKATDHMLKRMAMRNATSST
jgi:hypothetical protein|tara:strand:+ start:3791 stop:4006 length:216 start_codon:yes stop_codon:yes gene_type:complete